jgi:hypothetical protein
MRRLWHIPEKTKTYGSVFGMIFFGGVALPHVVERQWLATQEIPKNLENTKKSAK